MALGVGRMAKSVSIRVTTFVGSLLLLASWAPAAAAQDLAEPPDDHLRIEIVDWVLWIVECGILDMCGCEVIICPIDPLVKIETKRT